MPKILLANIDTKAPKGYYKEKTKAKTSKLLNELDELQNLLYAQNKHSVLVIVQGMDASGKDGATRNVFAHLNPMGVNVASFKAPTVEELSHDFLWRIHKHMPAKGMIQIFNRSHYEDILITRVHKMIDEKTAKLRMKAINDFEELITKHNNTHVLKFYLHISPEEQQLRLAERLKDPRKMWKHNDNDFNEAKLRDTYMKVYDDCFNQCNKIPWIITPSDQNWYKEHVIATALHKLLKSLKMQYPVIKK
ncbi:MAG: polyphosphate kinase [Deinococcales bacterium]|nr:polyphosphate kinase [Chitinophagaceae bacterium]